MSQNSLLADDIFRKNTHTPSYAYSYTAHIIQSDQDPVIFNCLYIQKSKDLLKS